MLRQYPNWVLALDEEGEPDQDETTIKPEGQQPFVSSGVRTVGFLRVTQWEVQSLHIAIDDDWWSLERTEGDCGAVLSPPGPA